MTQVHFALGFHCHQPVGNFDWVIEDVYSRAYAPLLDALAGREAIPFSLHLSGPLLEWLAERHPEFLDKLRKLVEAGRVELKGGPFYEAILPLISREDRAEQFALMRDFLKKRIGACPEGAWIPERVWEPALARDLAEADLRFAVLDDWHFLRAGVRRRELHSYFTTEDQGYRVELFPIDQTLRYLIPFREPEEVEKYLRTLVEKTCQGARGTPKKVADSHERPLLVVCEDDGEKFGSWPDTHEHVWGGWMDRFLGMLEEAAREGWLQLTTPGRFRQQYPPRRLVYVPHASYREMMEWAQGHFRSFLTRYEEANRLHKRMLDLSQRTRASCHIGAARHHVLRAQCNDAYWHGVFGGIYLPHLRRAIWKELLQAEALLPRSPGRYICDLDHDGDADVVLRSAHLNVVVAPARGGSIWALDHLPSATPLLDTLRRRREPEHKELLALAAADTDSSEDGCGQAQGPAEDPSDTRPRTIHHRPLRPDPSLARLLVVDPLPRDMLLDHFLEGEFSWGDLQRGFVREVGTFLATPYSLSDCSSAPGDPTVTLQAEGKVKGRVTCIAKRIVVSAAAPEIEVEYRISLGSSGRDARTALRHPALPRRSLTELWFAPEITINMLAGSSPTHEVLIDDSKPLDNWHLGDGGTHPGASSAALVDKPGGLTVHLTWQAHLAEKETVLPATLHRYGVFTVSRSEAGFEQVFQGTCLVPAWPLQLGAGDELVCTVRVTVAYNPPESSSTFSRCN